MASLFYTALNERSFSALVDRVILETGKVQSFVSVIQYANLTVRECQAFGLFPQDLTEETVVTDAMPFIWKRPVWFRSLQAALYMTQKIYPRLKRIGNQQKDLRYFLYAADDYFVFKGALQPETVALAYYKWQKPLRYFERWGVDSSTFSGGPYDTRLAYFDTDVETWMYFADTDDIYVPTLNDPPEEMYRRQNASNWLINEFWDMILEGTKAKIFKAFNDERSTASYALYKLAQKTFQTTMGIEAEAASLDMGAA